MKHLDKEIFHLVNGGGNAGNQVGSAISATAAAAAVAVAATPIGAAVATGVAIGAAISAVSNNVGTSSPAPASPDTSPSFDPLGNVIGAVPSNEVTCNDGGGGGGGKVICTELCRNGAIEHEVWMANIRYSRQNFSEQTMRGYHLWGIPYVKLMRKYPSFAKLAEHPTRWFAEDIAYRMGVLSKPNYKGRVLREVFFRPVCFGIGLFAKARDWQALWRDGVTPAGVRS
jgi:hypothetical protein